MRKEEMLKKEIMQRWECHEYYDNYESLFLHMVSLDSIVEFYVVECSPEKKFISRYGDVLVGFIYETGHEDVIQGDLTVAGNFLYRVELKKHIWTPVCDSCFLPLLNIQCSLVKLEVSRPIKVIYGLLGRNDDRMWLSNHRFRIHYNEHSYIIGTNRANSIVDLGRCFS